LHNDTVGCADPAVLQVRGIHVDAVEKKLNNGRHQDIHSWHYDSQAPDLTVNSARSSGGLLRLDLTVGAGAAKVEAVVNDQLLDQIAIGDFTDIEFDISHLQAGTYDLTITVYDRFLNENSRTITINYTSVHGAEQHLPESAMLHQNYPNPFNQETQIAFELDRVCTIDLRIYNVRGNLIRILAASESYEPGFNVVKWDGKDNMGQDVPSGIYLYSLKTESIQEARSLLLLR
jgi:hypothetical protein